MLTDEKIQLQNWGYCKGRVGGGREVTQRNIVEDGGSFAIWYGMNMHYCRGWTYNTKTNTV